MVLSSTVFASLSKTYLSSDDEIVEYNRNKDGL